MLHLENISCGYGSKFRIEALNFRVENGIFAGIIGPNGSGKTTLFRAMTRAIRLDGGQIHLNSKELHSLSGAEISRTIAVVTQNPNTWIDIKVEDYVLLGRIPFRQKIQFFDTAEDRRIAREVMELTDIAGLKDRIFGSLSGGEMQMAVIARALAQEPGILLLDEPTNHLDIAHQVRILDLLKRLNREKGLTVLIVLHDLNLASEYCDKLLLLDHGKVYKQGSPKEVLTYQHIEAVYKTAVLVNDNPISGKPCIFLVSEEEKEHERQRREK